MDYSSSHTSDCPDESSSDLLTQLSSVVPDNENVLEMAVEGEGIPYENLSNSVMSSTPLNYSLQRIMDDSCTDLNKDLSPVMQRLKLLESQLESNDEVIHEMERSLKAKTPCSEIEQPIDEVESLKKTISTLQDKVASAETTIYNLEEEIEEKNKLIEARTMVISVLQKDVEAKRVATNSMFEKTQQEIQNMHENFMAFKENMAIENKKLLDQLDSSRQRYRKLDLKLKETEKEKGNLIQMNNDLNFQIENIMSLNNQLKMKVVELTENIDSPKQKIRELTDELENVKQEFKKTVLNLELEIAHYKGECEKVKKNFEENQQLLEGEVVQLKEENNSLASKISNFKKEISTLESGKKQKEVTLIALIEEKENLISEMKQRIERFNSERTELINRLTETQSSLEVKDSNFEQMKAEVLELRSALNAVKQSDNNEEVACSLNNEINVLQDQLCQTKNELQQEKQRVQMLTETIDELEEKIQDSDLLLLEEKQNTINIKKELDHLKKQIAEKEEELVREKGSAAQLQENFFHVLNELEQYKQHFSETSNDTLEIQQKLESAEEEKSRLETVISSLLRDVISMTAKSTETEINFEKENQLYVILQEKFTELSSVFLQTTSDLKSKEEAVIKLQAELDCLLKDKGDVVANLQAQYDNMLKSKEDTIASLQAELNSLKQNDEEQISLRDMEAYIAQQDEMIKELKTNAQIKSEEANRLAASCEELNQRLNEYAAYTTSELGIRDNVIKSLQSTLECKNEGEGPSVELQTLQARAIYLEQMLMEANSNLEGQISKLRALENENQLLVSKLSKMSDESDLSELKKIVSDSERKLAEKSKSLDQLSIQHDELLVKFNEISNHLSAADTELINKDHAIKNLESLIKTIQDEGVQKLEELKLSLDEKENVYQKIKSDYDSVCSQLIEIQQTLQSKVELCDRLKIEMDRLSAENAKLSSFEVRCAELSQQLESLQISKGQRHMEVEQELTQITNVTQQLTDENNKLLNQVIELNDKLKCIEIDKIALSDELENLKESLRGLKDENALLKEEASLSSRLQAQVQDLEHLIKEKDQLISAVQLKISAVEESVREQGKSIEGANTLKNQSAECYLLPLTQEYLQINYQLMILKDLLEDLVNCEIGELSPESDLKLILENLESDLQESEVALKSYESKLRRSPGFGSDSVELSVSTLRNYVDQITKQISICGEVLKDWVLIKTPPKKSTFNVEIQTDFSLESKLTSRLNSENLDDWNWDVENNEDSGALQDQNQMLCEVPNKVVSRTGEEVSLDSGTDLYGNVTSLPTVMSLEGASVNASIFGNGTSATEASITTTALTENQLMNSQISGDWLEPESGAISSDQEERFVIRETENNHTVSNLDQSHEPNRSHEHAFHEDHLHDHENTHPHLHGPHEHEHRHDHEHSHEHDHDHDHDHEHLHGSFEENNRLTHTAYEGNENLGDSEVPDHSHSEDESYGGGYLHDNQLIVVNKAFYEDMKVKLDSVLYKLHEKDVQNNEFKRELIELLKERDILQLKLSSAYRLLASQEKEVTDANETSNSIKNEELISKINELDSLSGWHDPRVKTELEQKNMQALYSNQALPPNLRPQTEADLTETESESAIYSLFNWITGSR